MPLCGEAVGRGVRILVVDSAGAVIPTLSRLSLSSTGTSPNVNINISNPTPTTINPPTSCEQIVYQYENQLLPATEAAGRSSSYSLTVAAGTRQASQAFTLGVNEFKRIVITLDTVPPTIVAPASIVARATSPKGARVYYRARATDNVDRHVTVSCRPRSGSRFATGRTTVTCTAHDKTGNQTRRRLPVIVRP